MDKTKQGMWKEHQQKAIESVKKAVIAQIFHYIDNPKNDGTVDDFVEKNEPFLRKVTVHTWRTRLTTAIPREERPLYIEGERANATVSDEQFIAHFDDLDFDVYAWVHKEIAPRWGELVHERKKKRFLDHCYLPYIQDRMREQKEYAYMAIRKEWALHILRDLKDKKAYRLHPATGELEETDVFLREVSLYVVNDVWDVYTGQTKKKKKNKKKKPKKQRYGDVYQALGQVFVQETLCLDWLKEALKRYEQEADGLTINAFTWKDMPTKVVYLWHHFLAQATERMKKEKVEECVHFATSDVDALYRKQIEEAQALIEKKEQEKRAKEEQVLHIFGNEYEHVAKEGTRYVLHLGETNTGKTYHALETLKKHQKGVYLAPLRLLALEVFDTLNKEGVRCNLRTGEESKWVDGATHDACTVEMFDAREPYDVVVIDETQMIADKDRGFSWYRAISKARAKEVHIIGNPSIKDLVLELLGEESEVQIVTYERQTPLQVQKKPFRIQSVQKGDALIAFSRKRVLQIAGKLEADGHRVSVIYGNMPPDSRQRQMEDFNTGKTHVVVGTDAIGMGLNLPIRRIVFMDTEKFDGVRRRVLTTQEVKQIAGRAGRKGLYEEGVVVFTSNRRSLTKKLFSEDPSIRLFSIAPTQAVIERFSSYYRELDMFFTFWDKYQNPKGTVKATLADERDLFATVRGSIVERAFPMGELYSFLQMPFSSRDPLLARQWRDAMIALAKNEDMLEPVVQDGSLEALELSYKSVELYLMFLYRLGRQTEAYYWERVKKEISADIDQWLKKNMKDYRKACNRCQALLDWDYTYGICEACYHKQYGEDTSF